MRIIYNSANLFNSISVYRKVGCYTRYLAAILIVDVISAWTILVTLLSISSSHLRKDVSSHCFILILILPYFHCRKAIIHNKGLITVLLLFHHPLWNKSISISSKMSQLVLLRLHGKNFQIFIIGKNAIP